MPLEGTCDDLQKLHLNFGLDGRLDLPPEIVVLSGKSTATLDADGQGAYFISEDHVQGNGPFDTVYHIQMIVKGAELPGDHDVILHVENNMATGATFAFGDPEPK